jgi:predicted RNase H-like HicB family nuclease
MPMASCRQVFGGYVKPCLKTTGLILGGVYVPDLPGCVATGSTIEEISAEIQAAISFHLEGLQLEGLPIPEPTTICEYIEAA